MPKVGGAAAGRGAAARGGGKALQRRAGAVGVAAGPRLKAPATVAVLRPAKPGRGAVERRARGARRAQREHAERGQVDLLLEGAAPGAPPAKLSDQVVVSESPRIDARSLERQHGSLEVSR